MRNTHAAAELHVSQAEGWMLLSCVLNIALVACQLETLAHVLPGTLGLCACGAAVANGLLLVSPFFFEAADEARETPPSSPQWAGWPKEASVVWMLGIGLAVVPQLVLYGAQVILVPEACICGLRVS